ncbi:MAG: SpoIIE family protein phosphatase [Cyanobacteria bacterium SBLK]|nr:SpoIIE family protein phosphatase [Cyanobacteria bacterium SBLK]
MTEDERQAEQERELQRLRRQVAEMAMEKAAFEAQRKLLEGFIAIARSPSQNELLNQFLRQTLDISAEMTGAEKGSLFLLDASGKIQDAILTREDADPDGRFRLYNNILDRGLAGWVCQQRKIGLIVDTRDDDRWLQFPDQPYVVRSALGIPILRREGLFGLLTLLHSQPNHFGFDEVSLMQAMADQLGIVLENAQLYGQLQHYTATLNDELEKGRNIQLNFLPERIPQWSGWEIAAFFQPARQVAGDFYDIFALPGEQVGLAIADVCDKGVGAALFMGLFRSLIRIFSGQTNLEGLSFRGDLTASLYVELSELDEDGLPLSGNFGETVNPAHLNALRAIRLTNDYIAINHGDLGMFATLFFGVLDPNSGILTYINCGHESPLLLDRRGNVREELRATGPALGLLAGMTYRVRQTHFDFGEVLLGYTDGITEARAADDRFFSLARLEEVFSMGISSAQGLLQDIADRVREYAAGVEQFDDMTAIAVRRKEEA